MPTQLWPAQHRPLRCSAGRKDGACLSCPRIWTERVTLQARPCSWRPFRRRCKLRKNGSRSQIMIALRCQDVLIASVFADETLQVAKSESGASCDSLKMRLNGLAARLFYTQRSLVYHVCRTFRAASISTSRRRTTLWRKRCYRRSRCLLMSMKSWSGAKRIIHHI